MVISLGAVSALEGRLRASRLPVFAKPWGVVVIATGKKVGCHATKSDAQKQVAALNANVTKGSTMRETRVMRNVEVRAFTQDGEHFIDLKPIAVGVTDDYGSRWEPDTFDKYAGQRLPVLCWSHDWSDPLGPGVSYTPGDDGPTTRFKFSDFDAVPSARRAFAQVDDGTIVDCSVGFSNTKRRDPTDAEIEQYPGIREVIFEAELDEVSLVLRGAVPGAKVLALRTAGGKRETVPEEFVIDLARKVKAGDITKEEAKTALDLVADTGVPAPGGDAPGGEGGEGGGPGQPEDPPPSAAETEADEALERIEQV